MQFVALDDFDDSVAALGCGQCGVRPAIACVGEDADDEREQGARLLVEDEARTIAILDIGGVNGSAQQQAERVYENVAGYNFALLIRWLAALLRALFCALAATHFTTQPA